MLKFIRRISSSFIGRLDRPWDDDATSNAPQTGQKRRMTDDDDDERDDAMKFSSKRSRIVRGGDADEFGRESSSPQRDSSSPVADADADDEKEGSASSPAPNGVETTEVKEVTKGVKEVELEDKDVSEAETAPTDGADNATREVDADADADGEGEGDAEPSEHHRAQSPSLQEPLSASASAPRPLAEQEEGTAQDDLEPSDSAPVAVDVLDRDIQDLSQAPILMDPTSSTLDDIEHIQPVITMALGLQPQTVNAGAL